MTLQDALVISIRKNSGTFETDEEALIEVNRLFDAVKFYNGEGDGEDERANLLIIKSLIEAAEIYKNGN